MNNRLKFLCVLPNENYYIWQLLVQINNLKKYGWDKDTIYLIGNTNKNFNRNLIDEINCNCKFYFFDDQRVSAKYPSSLRPYILTKFFEEYNNVDFKSMAWFYMDPDIIFTQSIDFEKYINDDIWYLSDTRSYIDSNYIKSKSLDLFYEMCAIVGIDNKIVVNNDKNAGGAQYIMKNIDYKYWKKVYEDSEKLYQHMNNTKNKYNPSHPIQAWTADMWSVLWNSWLNHNETKIIKDLDFCWATDDIKKWNVCNIFHNAGATSDRKDLFVKTDYQVSPFFKDLSYVSNKFSCFNYVNEIKETEINYKNIIEKYF